MTIARTVVAVVPFGAVAKDPNAGPVARQAARRLVERFADHPTLDLRPVFLVALPEATTEAGYLVFGSTPADDLAAQYGESLGAAFALTGVLREEDGARRFEVRLVEVGTRKAIAHRRVDVGPDNLHEAEPELARWLASALAAPEPADLRPETANEKAYVALLAGLEEETNATLLRAGDPVRSDAARTLAFQLFVAAVRADPESLGAEDRLLVLAAESVERGDEERAARALEEVVEAKPLSWRAHYMLAELLRQIGETNHAIVALEHSHALHPLRDVDLMMLAELYVTEGAPGQAAAHLRRISEGSEAFGRAQELLGAIALQKGDTAGARTHFERAASNGRPVARAHLARAYIAEGRRDEARGTIDVILDTGDDPETLGQARRLRLGLDRPDLEETLERAGRAALSANATSLDAVKEQFEQVLAFDTAIWEAHFGIGLVARKREDYTAASRSFRRALELAPGQADVMHELGVALLASGERGDALELLDRAAELRPRDAAYIADAGFAHLRAGDLSAARDRLRIASTIEPDDPLTRAYLLELERAEAATGKPN